MYDANTNQKKAKVAIVTLDKVDIRTINIIRDKDGHKIMIKRSILQEDVTS